MRNPPNSLPFAAISMTRTQEEKFSSRNGACDNRRFCAPSRVAQVVHGASAANNRTLGCGLLRFHNLDSIPRGLTPDEAWNGLDALKILNGERPIFLTANYGREALFIYLQAISIGFLGQTASP